MIQPANTKSAEYNDDNRAFSGSKVPLDFIDFA